MKKSNEWKAVFTMLKESFELKMIFFGLTNL